MTHFQSSLLSAASGAREVETISNASVASDRKYKNPQVSKRPPSRLSLIAQDKWARRILGPYIPMVRRHVKASLRRDINYYNFFMTKHSSVLMKSMRNYIANKKDLPALVYETANVLKALTESLGMRLYFVDELKDQLYQYQKNVTYPRCRVNYDLETCKSVACHVARSKEFVMVDDVTKDSRFPDGVSYKDNVKAVLCLPIVTLSATFAVIELYRDSASLPYKKNDLKLAVVLCSWVGLTVQENQEAHLLHQMQCVHSTLLQMVLLYYSNPETLESILSEVLKFAKKEIEAEKGRFYVITNHEHMVADVYEEGISDHNKFLVKKKEAVRFGLYSTVACHVFRELQTINVKDLCNDPRFKTQISMDDEMLVIERTELCVPIVINGILLGIISLVNKANESFFTNDDEELMNVVAVHAGLILFYAHGRRELARTKTYMECVQDLLQYHLKPCKMELEQLKSETEYVFPKNLLESVILFSQEANCSEMCVLLSFSYYILPDDMVYMPHIYVKMVRDVIPDEYINFEDLYGFVLTAQRSYRPNPYHNFEHAFNVSHCMYTILIRNLDKFSLLEREALMIAALTHDIDHTGVTNNFLLITNHRFSLLYEDSVWENHHCFVTEQLLMRYHIFNNITETNLPEYLRQIHENIIFTDMVYYFKNRNKLMPLLIANEFDFNNPTHMYLLRNVCMTMADLSGQGKPFSITKRLTDALYREFYAQGDKEKELGFTPLPIMDRDNESQIPDDQSQFLSIVVMSAANLIRMLLPNTDDIYVNAEMLRDTWRRILESRGQKLWRQCDSLVS